MDMATRMDGKAVSAKVKEQVAQEVAALQGQGVCPGLAVVIVGEDPASRIYVNNKKKACQATGIHSEEYALPASTTQEELMALVDTLNHKEDIHGILVQSPCPRAWTRAPWWRPSTPKRTWTPSTPTTWAKS